MPKLDPFTKPKIDRVYREALKVIAEAYGVEPLAVHAFIRTLRVPPTVQGNSEPKNITQNITEEPPAVMQSRLKPMAVEPRPVPGAVVYLKNAVTGEFLHQSCTIMTTVKEHRWRGSQAQASACRQRFEIARNLKMIAVSPAAPKL